MWVSLFKWFPKISFKLCSKKLNLMEISRAFSLSLPQFWGTRDRLCKNRVTSLLSMRCMLLRYSFGLRPNSRALGTAVWVITIGLSIKDDRSLKTSFSWPENKIDQSRSSCCGDFKDWRGSCRAEFFSAPRSRRSQKGAWHAGWSWTSVEKCPWISALDKTVRLWLLNVKQLLHCKWCNLSPAIEI